MLKIIQIFFGSLLISIIITILLLAISTLTNDQKLYMTYSFLSFPIMWIFLFIYFYKKEVESKSDIKYILFPYKSNDELLRFNDTSYTYHMSKNYIKKKRTTSHYDGIIFLIPIILLIGVLFYNSNIPIALLVLFIASAIATIYGGYKQTEIIYDNMNNYYIEVNKNIITIIQKNTQEEFGIDKLKEIKVKYINNTDNIQYLELLIKNNTEKKHIKLEGYANMPTLLNHLIFTAENYR